MAVRPWLEYVSRYPASARDFHRAFLDRHGHPVGLATYIEGRSNGCNADISRMHDERMLSVVPDLEVCFAGRQFQIPPGAVEVDVDRGLGAEDDPGAIRERGCPI